MQEERSLGPNGERDRVVCILCPGSTEFAGGVGRCVANLMEEMPRADPAVRYRFLDTRGSRHIAFSPAYFALALARLTGLAATGQVAVIHANLSARGSTLRKFFVVLVATLFRTPFILHLHDGRFDGFYRSLPALAQRAVRWMFERADHVIVLGPHWRQVLVQDVGVPSEKIDIVSNAVPAPLLPGGVAAQEGDTPHLVFLGRLWGPKGVSELLEALGRPELRALRWRATLAGDGDPAPYMEQARRLGIADRIAFPGWQDRAGVDRLLAEATILVLPSHAEGLPMVVLEALAWGVPVVATRVGTLPDFVSDGESALLVEPRDVEGLAHALRRAIASPELRAGLAARGREVFARNFDITIAARKVASIYRKVCAAPAEGGSPRAAFPREST